MYTHFSSWMGKITIAKLKYNIGQEALSLLREERDSFTRKLQNLARGVYMGLKMLIKEGEVGRT